MLTLPSLYQKSGHDCGQAAARVVYRYHGLRKADPPKGSELDGTHPAEMERAFRNAGLCVQSGEMAPADLRHHTRLGRPVVCLVTESDGEGHWVVVGGLVRGRVRFHCPTRGACAEPVAAFAARWHDSDRVAVRYERWGIAVWPG